MLPHTFFINLIASIRKYRPHRIISTYTYYFCFTISFRKYIPDRPVWFRIKFSAVGIFYTWLKLISLSLEPANCLGVRLSFCGFLLDEKGDIIINLPHSAQSVLKLRNLGEKQTFCKEKKSPRQMVFNTAVSFVGLVLTLDHAPYHGHKKKRAVDILTKNNVPVKAIHQIWYKAQSKRINPNSSRYDRSETRNRVSLDE